MTRNIFILTTVLLSALIFGAPSAGARTPERIDIRSLHFHLTLVSPFVVMTALNSSGQLVTYQGEGTIEWPQVGFCSPCIVPNRFSSDVFGSQFYFDWGFKKIVRVYLSSVDSDPIVVSPRYTWKPRILTMNGSTRITGRVDVEDEHGNVIASADDLDLRGGYILTFGFSTIPSGGRGVSFSRIDVDLNKPL